MTDEPARGGLGAESFVTTLGITYQQALVEQLVSVLGRLVTATDYREGGEAGHPDRLNQAPSRG